MQTIHYGVFENCTGLTTIVLSEALTSTGAAVFKGCTDGLGNTSVEVIGAVNSLMPVLNITAREETSNSTVHVNGVALPETEVSLYVDGRYVQTVKANKVGDYSADISQGDPVEGADSIGEDIHDLREKYENDPTLSAEQKAEFNRMANEAQAINIFTTLLKLSCTAGAIAGVLVFGPGAPVLASIALGGFVIGLMMDLVRTITMANLEPYGIEARFKWAIDPSGYVYDALTGERLSGVTVHAYWIENTEEDPSFFDTKPGDDEYGVLWDSMEYSQLNPLITDADGRYAWDVPGGWWRVKYEKEGYETVWSDWLPVPPPQTEVNIGMTPIATETEHTHQLTWVEATVTCTQDGNVEYYTCECGKWFADPEAAFEIVDKDSVYSAALGHRDDDHDHGCDACEEIISVCVDEDGNDTCDICGAAIHVLGDLNGDGEVDIFDANLIVSYYNGTIVNFPVLEQMG